MDTRLPQDDAASDAPPRFAAASARLTMDDPEVMASEARALGWNSEYLAQDSSYEVTLEAAQNGRLQLSRVHFRGASLARGEGPEDAYVFVLASTQATPSNFCGEALVPGRVGVIRPSRDYEFHTKAGDSLVMLAVSRPRVELEADRHCPSWHFGPGVHATLELVKPETKEQLARRWSRALDASLARPEWLRQAEHAGTLEDALATELIRAVAPPGEPPFEPARRLAARRLEAALRLRHKGAVDLTDLARRTGVAERTLRQGFLELYGCSPLSYLKALRLRTARHALATAPPGTRVGKVALDCGFTHLGRFSVEFGEAFGESPSEALHRSRPWSAQSVGLAGDTGIQ